MKKILSIFIIGILILGGIGAVALNVEKENNSLTINSEKQNGGSRDYTHTVFVEVATGQFCGPCSSWNTNIYNTYSSGQYDFEYVMMIAFGFGGWSDILFTQANIWRNLYGINAVPWSIMDGNYQSIVGNAPSQLPTKLNTCGNRAVPNINADIALTWLGNATIQIALQIINYETTTYNGYLRVPIAEVLSRYLTSGGDHYHHGFLDYAVPMNTAISIPAGGTYSNNIIWNGNLHSDNHGTYFGDITMGNIMVMMGVFNSNTNFVDETALGFIQVPPNTPSNPDPSNGQTNIPVNKILSWTGGDPNPHDTVTYDVYFGTSNPPPQVVSNQSQTSYDPGTLDFVTTYYWNIVSWDNHGTTAAGPIWQFTTRGNSPPGTPFSPNPANGENNIPINPTLSWNCVDPDGDKIYYDVYFEAENPNPTIIVSHNQTSKTYEPDQLEYNTAYYWKIVAWDKFGEMAEGPIWSFTTMEEPQYFPDLDCIGNLEWSKVKAGSSVSENLKVQNIGDPTSELFWRIEEYPEWGNWTFNPDHGDGLTPEDGYRTVQVTVVAPPDKNTEFTGEVKVINVNDPSDFKIIPVILDTPREKAFYINILERIFEKFPNVFPLLKIILGI